MTRTSLSLVLLLGCALPPVAAQVAPEFVTARKLIQRSMAPDSLPGLAIAVVRHDSIVWEEGFGWADREARVPVTVHTPFYLASVTKAITATAAMMLHEQGRLELDRPANDYLGESKLWSAAWDPSGATVRRIANHTAGLTTFDIGCPQQQPRCAMPSTAEIIRRYGVLVQMPGERYDYSNLGYLVLGEVVAHAARREFGAFLREALFQPIGMKHSSFGADAALQPQPAVPYHSVQGPLRDPPRLLSGASTVYASAHDVALFAQLHLKRRGVPGILSHAAIDTMHSAGVPAGGTSRYAFGWTIEEDRFGYRSLLAQGGTAAASAWLRVIPSEDVAVVVLANQGVGFLAEVIDEVLSAMLPRYRERRSEQLAPQAGGAARPAVPPPALDAAYTGAWTGIVRIETGDVPLQIAVTDSGAVRGTVASRSGESSGSARICCGGVMFRVGMTGDLVTADSSGGRQLVFYLRLRDGRLQGHVTTRPNPASGLEGRVSHWVELRKRP